MLCVGQGEIFLLHAIITSCHLARLAIFAGNANALPGYRINNLNLTIYIIIIHYSLEYFTPILAHVQNNEQQYISLRE
jgi:hypothetical protein